MSNNGGWKPRQTETLTLSSGQKVYVKRPGPEFLLKTGRVARTFTKAAKESPRKDDESVNEYGQRVIAEMSDEELAEVVIFARKLVVTMCVSPKLVLEPRQGYDEIGPDDIGNDFWELFNYGMTNFLGMKVPVGDTEVEVKDLESFRADEGVSSDSVDSARVSPDTQQFAGDRGLVDSAGA